MSYSKEIFDTARRSLAARRSTAEQEQALRKSALYEQVPRLAAIERELAQTALSLIKTVSAGAAQSARNGSAADGGASGGDDTAAGGTFGRIASLKEKNQLLQRERAQVLSDMGLPADYLDVRYTCPRCKDTGYLEYGRCACFEQLLREEACAQLNRQSPLTLCSFDNFDVALQEDTPDAHGISPRERAQTILDYCKQYAAAFSPDSPSILMVGKTGLGKTHLSLAIAQAVIYNGYGVVYQTAQNIADMLQRDYFGREQNASEPIETLGNCDLLIIDDLGTEFLSSFTQAAFFNLINNRILAHKPTILNTNLDIAEMESRYSERMVSRLFGGFKILSFSGRDIRLVKRR